MKQELQQHFYSHACLSHILFSSSNLHKFELAINNFARALMSHVGCRSINKVDSAAEKNPPHAQIEELPSLSVRAAC